MNTPLRGLIFDLDGTLVQSLPGIATALNYALKQNSHPTYSEKEVETFIGDGIETLVKRALLPDQQHLLPKILPDFQKHYSANWQNGTHPYPGVLDLLEELHAADIPMAVLSNKPHPYTVDIVKALFPSHLFQIVRGHEAQYPKKPDPTTALQIVASWNLTPQEVAYIGDSTVDLATARNGELIPLILSWGYGTPTDCALLHDTTDLKNAIIPPSS